MSRRLRLLVATASVAAVAGSAIPASASATPVITMSGSTSVAPLAALLAKTYLKQYPGQVKFKLAQGGSRRRHRRRRRRPRHDRQLLARPARPSDPGGLVFNKIARDAICLVTNPANPLAEPRRRRRSRRSSPAQVRNWERRPGRRRSPARSTSIVRTAASGTQDAFQKIFMGSATVDLDARRAKASNGLVQQAVAVRQERDRLRLAGLHQGRQRRRPTRASPATCATRSPASTAACATSGWSPAGTRARAPRRSSSTGSRTPAAPRRSSRTHWVPLK